MRRSHLALASAAVLTATVTGAQAAPAPVDHGRVAVTRLQVALGHGHLLSVELRAAALSGGNTLYVLTQRCDSDETCDPPTTYAGPLPATALTVAADTVAATLATNLAGHAVHVQWKPDGSTTAVVGGGEFEGGGTDASASEYAGDAASVAVDIDGVACRTDGAVGDAVVADTGAVTGGSTSATLADLRLPTRAPLTCG